ncbi:unnamed protein product [Cylindrotheca closterium]|uniref:F-box domain-containing protein n=1 Tax=Cylindrotheca closterium TaxID=2856 RepID=A0AAD2CEK8_9STRA|nr:unnamed protein product [Cylindrotheca closterium]
MTTTTSHQPVLPPLYFDNVKAPKTTEGKRDCTTSDLPAEILSLCLTRFADWGDLAKLAQVQKSWSSILDDAAGQSTDMKWELSQALLNGTCGLERNPKRAIAVMRELTNVNISDEFEPEVADNDAVCFAPALRAIANCYFEGNGVEKETKLGLAWLKAAFELGNDVDAAYETALIHEYGHHRVHVDVVAAAEWFQKAAEQNHVEAMSELALCYELGCGLEQNDEIALDWYTKAANLGHITSKYSVGEAFEEARGVPQSDEEACLWYYRAALAGDEDSKKSLRRLYDIARIVVPGVAEIFNA